MIARLDNWMNRGAGLWLCLAIMLVIALPGFFTLPPIDRDEVLFAQASSQMLASGDFVDIRFGDEVRYKKPIGIYWLQATVAGITGADGQIWAYRLVSLMGGLVAVGFTYRIARLVMPVAPATLAAVALATSFLMGAEVRLAKTDAVLLAAIMAGQYVLARVWLPAGRRQVTGLNLWLAMGFWAAQAAAVLVKGPIGPMVAVFTVIGLCALRRDFAVLRALRPLPGLALMVLLVAPWFIAITLVSDGDFWVKSLGQDMLAKIGTGQESHGAPPGSYLALVWVTFWPGSLLLAAGLPALWAARRDPAVQFALVWAVPIWLVFEFTATKLVHYVLPAYPALAILAGYALWVSVPGRAWVAWLLGLVPEAMLAAFVGAARQYDLPLSWPFWIGTAGLAGTVPLLVLSYRLRTYGTINLALVLCGLALSVAIYPSLARMQGLWPARPIAAFAAAYPGCTLTVAGYSEPSLLFLTRNAVHFADVPEAVAAYGAAGCQIVGLPAADAGSVNAQATKVVKGLNLGTGKPLELHLFLKP